MLDVLRKHILAADYIYKSELMFANIRYIQRTYLSKILKKESRVEILNNYWNKIIGKLMNAAIQKKDQPLKDLVSKIMLVDKNIKNIVLFKYVHQCQILHQIAFF